MSMENHRGRAAAPLDALEGSHSMKRLTAALLLVLGILTGATPAAAEPTQSPLDHVAQVAFHAKWVSTYQSATTIEELQFAADFRPEHSNLLRLYQAFFNRSPDLVGAKYWLGQWDNVVDAGPTPQRPEGHDLFGEFAQYFTQVPEFNNTYGDADNAEFLTRVYNNMLGRVPDVVGYDYWLSYLEGTNDERPGHVLSKGSLMRWVTLDTEFVSLYPFGHTDTSEHPSDDADCTAENVRFDNLTITGIYRLRDGAIRELCYGLPDENVEDAWARLAELADPSHRSPVALLAVFEGDGAGIVAYAGPSSGNGGDYVGDLWLIAAQDTATRINPVDADLTMSHELSHVFTQLDDQVDFDSLTRNGCDGRFPGFKWCYREDSFMNQWVTNFWSTQELAVYQANHDSDPYNDVDSETLCVDDHDFAGTYATTSPYEDFAEAFSAYVHGVDLTNLDAKFAYFDSQPILKSYRDRAAGTDRFNYPDTFGSCGV
jgi:hypothetical protein